MNNQKTPLIAASILGADFSQLKKEIQDMDRAGADWFHLDVMDGVFVPNLTFGSQLIKAIRPWTKKRFDAHLMMVNPEKYLDRLIDAGVNLITLHADLDLNYQKIFSRLHQQQILTGISLNPETEIQSIQQYLSKVDLVLIMGVNPGFGGQTFQPQVLKKIKKLYDFRTKNPNKYHYLIEVDGGMNPNTLPEVIEAGADVIVSGSFLFGQQNYHDGIEQLHLRKGNQ